MKRIFPYLSLIALLIFSCSDETTVFVEPEDELQLETNTAVLENSVDNSEIGVLDIFTDNTSKFPSKAKPGSENNYPLTLVAQIQPPSFSGGENLAASHVDLVDNFVYISYNTAGEVYAGAVDIVDVSDFMSPVVTSRLYYTNADLNAIKYENGFVYVVGGVDAEQSVTATANSFVAKIPANNGVMDTSSGIQFGFQEGFVGNDLVVNANGVFVTSGRDGYVTHFDKNTLEIQNESQYDDLRSIAETQNGYAVLDASHGVRFLDNGLAETNSISISADFRLADKRVLSVYNDRVAVPEGGDGAGIYNIQTGAFEGNLPIMLNPEGVIDSDIVTNAVAFNDDVFLMANGGAGLALSENEASLNLVGVIGLNGSINYVASKDDYILAASGRSGLQIIKMNRTPETLAQACENQPAYSGGNVLEVAVGEEESYSGSRSLNRINVAGDLLLCGNWGVRNDVTVNDSGLMEMRGIIYVGRNNSRRNIVVEQGATLRIEGYMVIFGDLILEDNARLEFVGSGSRAYIFGDVSQADSAQVSGDFWDVYDKF